MYSMIPITVTPRISAFLESCRIQARTGRTAASNNEPEPPEAAAHAVAARDEVGEQAGERARKEVHHAEDGGQVGGLGDAKAKVVLEEGRERIVQSELRNKVHTIRSGTPN